MIRRAGRALLRRGRRPARTPGPIRLLLALVLGSVAVIGIAAPVSSNAGGAASAVPAASAPPNSSTAPPAAAGGPPTSSLNAPAKAPEPAGPGGATTRFPTSAALISQGMSLYANGCSACHGALLEGETGVAPSLIGVGAGPVDFYLSTGRMPLANPREEPQRAPPAYGPQRIDALIAFISSVGGGPAAPQANPAAGDLAVGQHGFTLHCAGCHQIVARGGLTLGASVPNLDAATAQQIAEAVRMGPYMMPHFDAAEIDQHELDSIARYVIWARHPDNAGGWGIYNIGPIPEGMVAWFIALLAMVIVARVIGERTA